MGEYNAGNGYIYTGNGVSLVRVKFPDSVQQGETITVQFEIIKRELVPLDDRCGFNGKATKVTGIVDDMPQTSKELCISTDVPFGGFNKQMDISFPEDAEPGTHRVNLYFTQPSTGANQWDTSWGDMPESTVVFETELVATDNPDDPDDGNGGNGGGDTPDGGDGGGGGDGIGGQTILIGLVGAGLWARQRNKDK